MTKKEKSKINCWEDVLTLPEKDQYKYEIANELGLLDQVFRQGWGSLSSQDSGRIGGLVKNFQSKNK